MKLSWILCSICVLALSKVNVARASDCSFKELGKLTKNDEWAWLKNVEDIDIVELCGNDNPQELSYIVAYSNIREYKSVSYRVASYIEKRGEIITIGYLFLDDNKSGLIDQQCCMLNTSADVETAVSFYKETLHDKLDCFSSSACLYEEIASYSFFKKISNADYRNIRSLLKKSDVEISTDIFKYDENEKFSMVVDIDGSRWELIFKKNISKNLVLIDLDKLIVDSNSNA